MAGDPSNSQTEKSAMPNEGQQDKHQRQNRIVKIVFIIGASILLFLVAVSGIYIILLGQYGKSRVDVDKPSRSTNPLLVISLDGFGYDYLKYGMTPNIQKLVHDKDTVTMRMRPQFPSHTFPNHYTIVTGLLPQNHGIVNNAFLDGNSKFDMRDPSSVNNGKFWEGAEPIWNRIKMANKTSAAICWPGSNVSLKSGKPDRVKAFHSKTPLPLIVDQTLKWAPKSDITLMYYEKIDEVGHFHGPDGQELKDALAKVDEEIGRLVRSIDPKTNLIILSDHGMARLRNSVYLTQKLSNIRERSRKILFGPITFVYPKEGELDGLHRDLKKALSDTPIEVYKKEDIPEKWQYKNNSRIAPIILVSPIGWNIQATKPEGGDSRQRRQLKGAHGYDPDNPEMHAIFIAKGPGIKANNNLDNIIIENLDIHRLMCKLMGVPEPNDDGMNTLANLAHTM